MKEVLLAAQVAAYCLVLVLLLVMFRRERRLKKRQEALVSELLPTLPPGQRWFRVNLARRSFFGRRMRIFGVEAKGLLIDEGERLRLVGALPDGERFEQFVPKLPAAIRWRGNAGLASANLHWLELDSGGDAVMVCADTGMNATASREATADILRSLLPRQALDASALKDFALERHRGALAAVVVALALLVGALLDVAMNEHQLLQPRGLYLFTALAALSGLVVYPLLSRHGVPSRESVVLTMLMISGLAVALPVASLRLDQALSGGAVPTPYRLVRGTVLRPVEPGPPEVSLPDVREYWAQFEPDSVHQLDIVHGPLGLWQLDRSRLNALTRDWYRNQGDTPAKAQAAAGRSGRTASGAD